MEIEMIVVFIAGVGFGGTVVASGICFVIAMAARRAEEHYESEPAPIEKGDAASC